MLITMISLKKLITLARKWKTIAGIGTRTISLPRINRKLARAGHFVVYSLDERRFVVPLGYLHTNIFRELFRLSEEEFGLPRDGPIIFPCDAAVLEYVISLVPRHVSEKMEKALFALLTSHQYSTIASEELSWRQATMKNQILKKLHEEASRSYFWPRLETFLGR